MAMIKPNKKDYSIKDIQYIYDRILDNTVAFMKMSKVSVEFMRIKDIIGNNDYIDTDTGEVLYDKCFANKDVSSGLNSKRVSADNYILDGGESLANNILENGMYQPFYVREDEHGNVYIIEGKHRYVSLYRHAPDLRVLVIKTLNILPCEVIDARLKLNAPNASDYPLLDRNIDFYSSNYSGRDKYNDTYYFGNNTKVLDYNDNVIIINTDNIFNAIRAASYLGLVFSRLVYGKEQYIKPWKEFNNEEALSNI